MWRRIRHIIIKEFIQVLRDKKLRFFLIVPPLVQLLTYGYVVNFDIKHVALAVFDESRTMESRQLIDRFASNDWFNVKYFVNSQKELLHLVDRGDITMALWFQWDFATRMRQGKSGRLQVIVDATDSNAALIVSRYAGTVIADYNQQQLNQRLARQGQAWAGQSGLPLDIEPRAWFNPNLISRYSMVPGVIAMVVLLVSLMLTALSVVREKEIGTMEQILVTPIRPIELMLGKTIPFVIISLLEVAMVTALGILWFEVPFQGQLPGAAPGHHGLSVQFRGPGAADFHGLFHPAAGHDGRQPVSDPGHSPVRAHLSHRQHAGVLSVLDLSQPLDVLCHRHPGDLSQGRRPGPPVAPDHRHDRPGYGHARPGRGPL